MRIPPFTHPHIRGPDVEAWQRFLRDCRFYMGPIDGDFGEETERATIAFQERLGLAPDGVVTRETFERARRYGFSEPSPSRGPHYHTESNVELSLDAQREAERIADLYYRETGAEITITSGTRSAEGQAPARYHNLQRGTEPHYRNHRAHQEILQAYRDAQGSGAGERETVAAMALVISAQAARGD